nr:hypothetical protein [uncultured Clostridium sp.]
MEYVFLRDFDLGLLLEKMMDSNIVIFACPVYEQHVTAFMKN